MKKEFSRRDLIEYTRILKDSGELNSLLSNERLVAIFVSIKSMNQGESEPFTEIKGDGSKCEFIEQHDYYKNGNGQVYCHLCGEKL